jgi:hypothetical protein
LVPNRANAHFKLTYRLRPINGAICGLFVFALLDGGVLTLTVGQAPSILNSQTPALYIGLAILAGYGSHEFLKKGERYQSNHIYTE